MLLRTILPVVVVIGLALLMQGVVKPTVAPFHAKILIDIAIAIVAAVSLNLVNGLTGQFSMGHAGFMAVGGYFGAVITYFGSFRIWGDAAFRGGWISWSLPAEQFSGSIVGPGDLLFFVACIVGGTAAAALGYLVALPSLRLRGDYLAIVTLGFGEIIRVLLTQTRDVLGTAEQVAATPWWKLPLHLGGALGFSSAVGLPGYASHFWTWFWAGTVVLFGLRLKRSSAGRALLAIREDEIAAEAMGVNTTRYKVRAFVISAFFAGVAGCLFAHVIGTTLNPKELGFQKSFDLIIMVVLGGMGSISGVVLAAMILTVLPELLRDFNSYRMIIYALALILMMILRPKGLFGVNEVWELPPVRRLLKWIRGRSRPPSGGGSAAPAAPVKGTSPGDSSS